MRLNKTFVWRRFAQHPGVPYTKSTIEKNRDTYSKSGKNISSSTFPKTNDFSDSKITQLCFITFPQRMILILHRS